ncbi:ribosome small subunit-dependent GTPase A [Adlercreutzia sp. ZJ141]|uniref:ribosome small subunit-dependent GTPase A n=1 Tax=Adlercreutzia sp. ZJ141 TaxID=2709406 RepID=UPI0013EB5D01|nr:ribosome small subunit-dependent GTPase A [Adlercreutzia sp. ZJ141]
MGAELFDNERTKASAALAASLVRGQVIKLDRGYPLVRVLEENAAALDEPGASGAPCVSASPTASTAPTAPASPAQLVRCEHATALVKGTRERATIGDFVEVDVPAGHDKGIITRILPRTRAFVRKDPTERSLPQVLAANFDVVIVAQPLANVNVRRMERELVLAHETGARVAVVLTKADLAESEGQVERVRREVADLVGPDVTVAVVSSDDAASVCAVREMIPENVTAVLLGKSGVGKSSLVNMLVGSDVQATATVREGDGKGRHTTVSRDMVTLPGGGFVVDMPGVRGLGLWNADEGIGAAFSDIERLAEQCRFRDCKHENEPGCAVRAAVEAGTLSENRFASYQALRRETADQAARQEEARRRRHEKQTFGNQGRGKRKCARSSNM